MPQEESSRKTFAEVKDFTIPPWKMYPEIEFRSIGWRAGYGEYYIVRWWKYYDSLSQKEKEQYRIANAEPEEWLGTYELHDRNWEKKRRYENDL